ncbi:unnamed protein product, partial [Mesorhabditis spiculigera]
MSRHGDDRSRARSRYDETGDALSSFYRERFGSQSPDEYLNLRITQIDKGLQRDEIKDILYQEFKKYVPFEVKVVRNPGDEDRLAYVNFERKDAARKIRHTMLARLQKLLGRRILVDPAGIIRDQDGKFIPDRFNRASMQEQQRNRSGGRGISPRRSGGQGTWRLTEDDQKATRSLFVGNMPSDIHESEIRRVFEKYGGVEEVDIKRVENSTAAYAFVQFATIDAALDAKHNEHERAIRHGGPKCKIGYGKSQVSRKLWVGGLGPWVSADELSKEFDRYGPIDKLDYEEGSDHAYILYADLNAASDASRAMRNFDFDDHVIQIDYAKEDTAVRKRIGDRDHSPSSKRARESPPPAGKPIRTIEQLDEQYAFTWVGHVLLKKAEYALRLYRVAGTEKLLQTMLRDSDGNAVKLHVTQRLALSTQESLQDRLLASPIKQLAIMIGVGKEPKSIQPFANYLAEKDAAGVVTINDGIVYVFPPSDMATHLLARFAPNIHLLVDGAPNLLFILAPKVTSSSSP